MLCFIVNAPSQVSLLGTANIKRTSFSARMASSLWVIIQCRLRSAVTLVLDAIIFAELAMSVAPLCSKSQTKGINPSSRFILLLY